MLVNSVTGPVDTSTLGRTLTHEHVFVINRDLAFAFPDRVPVDAELEKFKNAIERLKPYGLGTIMDPSMIDYGRDVLLLKRASEMTGINILACTGKYFTEYPWYRFVRERPYPCVDEDILADLFIRELTQGIQGTDIKAAFVKCATDDAYGFSTSNIAFIKAAGKAARETGRPVSTHGSCYSRQGLEQQRILVEEAGVKPHCICLGHCFAGGDMEYVEEIIKKGSYVGADQMGITNIRSVENYAKDIAKLLRKDKNYVDYILLSHDATIYSDFGLSLSSRRCDPEKNTLLGDFHQIFEELPAFLEKEGVGQEEFDKMTIDNPRRYIECRPLEH